MLTEEQILKVARLLDQTGGSEGFYEPDFDKHQHNKKPFLKTEKLNLTCNSKN